MPALFSYWKKRKSALNFLLRTPKRKFGQSKFHRLRVELKKLKAILSLAKSHQKEVDQKRFYKPFGKLFSQAGKVRELQIEKEILKKYRASESTPKLLKSIDKKIGIEKKVFFKTRNLNLCDKIKKRFKRLNPRIRDLEKRDLSGYLNSQLEAIRLILSSGKLDEANGHLVRKKLKTFKYNLESLRPKGISASFSKLDELLELLGFWHDLAMVYQALKQDLSSGHFSPEERINIQQILKKIRTSTNDLIVEINQKTNLLDDVDLLAKLKI